MSHLTQIKSEPLFRKTGPFAQCLGVTQEGADGNSRTQGEGSLRASD